MSPQLQQLNQPSDFEVIDPSDFPKRSAEPVIVVIDQFKKKTVDIDGDQRMFSEESKADISHGEAVVAHLKMALPQAHIVCIESEKTDDRKLLAELLKLKKSGHQIDAINLSRAIAHLTLTPSQWTAMTGVKVTKENLLEIRKEVKAKIAELSKIKYSPFAGAHRTIVGLERLAANGVKVYIGAGNDGPEFISAYNFAEGTFGVRAVDANKIPSEYSAHNQLLNRTARGDFNSVPIRDNGRTLGYDITGDGTLDVRAARTSSKGTFTDPIIERFSGKRISDAVVSGAMRKRILDNHTHRWASVIKKNTPHELLKMISQPDDRKRRVSPLEENGIIPLKDMLLHIGYSEQEAEFARKQIGDYFHISGIVFRATKEGTLLHSYDGSNRAGVADVSGTSFATPTALAQDLRGKK